MNKLRQYWKLIATILFGYFIWTIKTIDILVAGCASEVFNLGYRIFCGNIPPMFSPRYLFTKNEYEGYFTLRENISYFFSFFIVTVFAATVSYYFHKFLTFCERVYLNMWPPAPTVPPTLSSPIPQRSAQPLVVLSREVQEQLREDLPRTASATHLSGQNSQEGSPRGPLLPEAFPVEDSLDNSFNSGSGVEAALAVVRQRAGSAYSRLQSSQTFSSFAAAAAAAAEDEAPLPLPLPLASPSPFSTNSRGSVDGHRLAVPPLREEGVRSASPAPFYTNSRASMSGEPQRVSHRMAVPPREEGGSVLRLRSRGEGGTLQNDQYAEPPSPRFLPSIPTSSAPTGPRSSFPLTPEQAQRFLQAAEDLRDSVRNFEQKPQ